MTEYHIIEGTVPDILQDLEKFPKPNHLHTDPPMNLGYERQFTRLRKDKTAGTPVNMDFGCLVKGTLIQTREGIRRIEDINVGDYVFNKRGWCEVKNKFEYDVDIPVKVINISKHEDVILTLSHKISVRRIGHVVDIEASKIKGKKEYPQHPDYVAFYKYMHAIDPPVFEVRKSWSSSLYTIDPSTSLFRIFGAYLGDGSLVGNAGIRICLDKKHKRIISTLVGDIVKVFGKAPCIVDRHPARAIELRINRVGIAELFIRLFGRNKKVPSSFFSLHNTYLHALLDGLTLSDGFVSNYNTEIVSSNCSISSLLLHICNNLGISTSIYVRRSSRRRNQFRFFLSKNKGNMTINTKEYIAYRINSAADSRYKGKVYDLSVNLDRHYTTISGCVHNSWDSFGHKKKGSSLDESYDSDVGFLSWTYGWLDNLDPYMVRDSTICMWMADRYLSDVRRHLKYKLGYQYLYTFYWHVTNPPPRWLKGSLVPSVVPCIVGCRTKDSTFNWLDDFKKMHNFMETTICSGEERIKFIDPDRNQDKPTSHPTQKPIEVEYRLFKIFTKSQQWCIDPFMGVGSSLIAGLHHGLNVVGIDNKRLYVKQAELRVKNYLEHGLPERLKKKMLLEDSVVIR